MMSSWLIASVGGIMIGAASALLLVSHGRIAGISGIVGGLAAAERAWRVAFLGGLAAAGVTAAIVAPATIGSSPRSGVGLVMAGLLVGFGTRLGNGCTSGHGVCGLSLGARRSFVAVATFMASGAIVAMLAGRLS